MSADNGVYILVTRRNGGRGKKVYRVAHCQAIEDLTDSPDYPLHCPEVNLDETLSRFGDSRVFTDQKIAEGYAIRWVEEIERSGGVCQYGIQWLEFPTINFPGRPPQRRRPVWANAAMA